MTLSIIIFDLNVLWIKCPINKTINSGLGIKSLVYKMVSLMSYVMYHIQSDIKEFVCIFVIIDRLMLCFIVLIVIFMNCSGLSAFLSHFWIQTIPHFVRQILLEKLWIPDKKYFVQPWGGGASLWPKNNMIWYMNNPKEVIPSF